MRDDVTLRLTLMVRGMNEQLQKDILGIGYEGRQKGNSAYYLPARVELEIKNTDERAQALYDACCEVWEIHGLKRSRAFFRAVFDYCLTPLFATRRSCLQAELTSRDSVLRTPGGSTAAQRSLARRMDQLRAKWNTKLEIETRDIETRERLAQARDAHTAQAPVRSSSPIANRSKTGRKERRAHDFTAFAGSLWKQKKGTTGRVSHDDLKAIGDELDSQKLIPPARYLEKNAAKELKARNSKNANSKSGGAIQTWGVLVTRADKDDLRAMRRLLIRCASKQP